MRNPQRHRKSKSRARRFVEHVVRTALFVVLALAVFTYANMVVGYQGTQQDVGMFRAFYDEAEDSVDVCYFGNSAASRFFNPTFAYHETGLASVVFGVQGMCPFHTDNIIDEALRTQDPKLIVIDVRGYANSIGNVDEGDCRRVTDSMNLLSPNREVMVREFLSTMEKYQPDGDYDTDFKDYIFPLIKYHSQLTDGSLTLEDLTLSGKPYNTLKGFSLSSRSVTQVPRTKPDFTDEVGELSEYQTEILQQLLDRCEELDCEVLFVETPGKVKAEKYALFNAVEKQVEDRGWTCLNFNSDEMIDELGLDFSTDFYNNLHVNYLGSEKYVTWLSNYIHEHYDLPDRRSDGAYQSWEDGYERYEDYVAKGIRIVSDKQAQG